MRARNQGQARIWGSADLVKTSAIANTGNLRLHVRGDIMAGA
jgi:hypothetical protein